MTLNPYANLFKGEEQICIYEVNKESGQITNGQRWLTTYGIIRRRYTEINRYTLKFERFL